ncbi:zinc finger protein 385B-like [Meriones unguiculatus]|uniref:zinc finger protein 385B-like n=1 Tax=Meriones unguiculatus TaxID=10047 RepID=UPI00293E2E1E|nr:zinc finger protein 385B-like [Meriones unguiculatus]
MATRSGHYCGSRNMRWLAHICADFTSAQDGESEAELLLPDELGEKPGREKRQSNFTLCSVCNIQLNSAAQAQIHYHGKSHQKRLKQLTSGTLQNNSENRSLPQPTHPNTSCLSRAEQIFIQ